GARGEPRHRGGGEVGAELGQRVGGERLTRERTQAEPSDERRRDEAAWNHRLHAQFPFGAAPRRLCCFTRDDRPHPARRLLETFSWSFCLMGPKTSCIARTRV